MAVRFYNAGGAIDARYQFDNPRNDPKVENLVSYHHLAVKAESFFEVPSQVTVQTDLGELTAALNLAKRIKDDYRDLGVVMITPNPKAPIAELDNAALTDKEAKEKAEGMWLEAMFRLVREHEQQCITLREAGLRPKRAWGNVAHALKTLGVEDPANDVQDVVKRKQDTTETDQLKAQVAALQNAVNQLVGAKAAK